MWSNLAHEMTSEFRSLCAEEVGSFLYYNFRFKVKTEDVVCASQGVDYYFSLESLIVGILAARA